MICQYPRIVTNHRTMKHRITIERPRRKISCEMSVTNEQGASRGRRTELYSTRGQGYSEAAREVS